MYDELVKRLRYCADSDNQCSECKYHGGSPDGSKMCLDVLMEDAADAIEERDRYALTIQHEMMSEAESHIALVERLNKQIEELSKRAKEWEALHDIWKAGCEGLQERMPRWIPVTERCPEKSGDYLVFDDCRNLYVNEWHCLLKKWQYDDSRITHWMPLPEPPKEGQA